MTFFGKKSAFLVVLWLAAFIAFTSIHNHTGDHVGQITQQCQMCSFANQAQGSIETPQQAFIPYNPVLSPVIATQDFFASLFTCSPRNSRAPPLV